VKRIGFELFELGRDGLKAPAIGVPSGMNMQRFVVLDSWRGIAACLVALFHFDAYSHLYGVAVPAQLLAFRRFLFRTERLCHRRELPAAIARRFWHGAVSLAAAGQALSAAFAMLALFVGSELLKVLRRILIPASLWAINPIAPFSTPQQAPDTILANLLLVHSLHLYDFLTWNIPSWSLARSSTPTSFSQRA